MKMETMEWDFGKAAEKAVRAGAPSVNGKLAFPYSLIKTNRGIVYSNQENYPAPMRGKGLVMKITRSYHD